MKVGGDRVSGNQRCDVHEDTELNASSKQTMGTKPQTVASCSFNLINLFIFVFMFQQHAAIPVKQKEMGKVEECSSYDWWRRERRGDVVLYNHEVWLVGLNFLTMCWCTWVKIFFLFFFFFGALKCQKPLTIVFLFCFLTRHCTSIHGKNK